LFRIEEALRDYHSLVSKGVEKETSAELIKTIDFRKIEDFILKVREATDLTQLRELVSLTTAYALAEAARLQSRETYLLATKIMDQLRREEVVKEGMNAQAVSKAIESNAERIAKELSIPVDRVLEIAMPTYTLTARQRDVLSLLPCRVTELSRKLKISKSTASRLLRNLVKKGLAYRSGGGKVFEPTLTGRILLKMLTEVRGSVNTHSIDF
jgi:predicted transcriptional regulator